MDEAVVDPSYEYEAPQFFDFVNGDLQEEEPADAWFDHKIDDEGGRPIMEDFEPEKAESSETAKVESCSTENVPMAIEAQGEDRNIEQANPAEPKELNVKEKVVELANLEASEEHSDEQPSQNVALDNHNDSLNETEPKDQTDASQSSSDVEQKHEVDSKEIEESKPQPKPSNIVTSWADWGRSKAKSTQSEANKTSDKTDEPKMVTRTQKRHNSLNASASSGLPSKKQKQTPEFNKEAKPARRPRSLCSQPEKKPSLTLPVTPQCLKRQKKTGKPTIIKLKTTEEMEMECIAKMRRKTRHHIKVNENIMKKAISSTSYHPVRAMVDATKIEEFHFQTDKRVKAHPMATRADDTEKEFLKSLRQHPPSPNWKNRGVTVPKPFNLSDGGQAKRKLAALDTDEKTTDSYESMAYKVYKFQKTTPPRFRTKKASSEERTETNKPATAEKPLKTTCPVTPKLSTSSRARPIAEDVLSKEQQEEKEAEAMKSYQFKARPFDRRIVECEGLYGVKTHKDQKQVTEVVPFSFESDERLEARKQEKKADSQEDLAPFKALPQPNFEKVFRPQLKHARTEPKPFSFQEKDKERWQKKELKIQNVYKEEEKLREFKAQLLPPDSPDTLPEVSSKCCTSFKPFQLNTENRGAMKAEKWMQKVQTELQEQRKKTAFQAKPNKVTHEAPFVPQKSQKPLTEVSEFALNTNRRAEQWEEIETVKKERELVDEELRQEREKRQQEEEKEAIALLRKQLVHKAQPILKYKEVVIKPSDIPLTEAQSPAWSDMKRRRVENIR